MHTQTLKAYSTTIGDAKISRSRPYLGNELPCNGYSSTLCLRKVSPTFSTVTGKPIIRFDNFRYRYFWQNLQSNDHSVSHLTQRLFLHYLGIAEPAKYHLFIQRDVIV